MADDWGDWDTPSEYSHGSQQAKTEWGWDAPQNSSSSTNHHSSTSHGFAVLPKPSYNSRLDARSDSSQQSRNFRSNYKHNNRFQSDSRAGSSDSWRSKREHSEHSSSHSQHSFHSRAPSSSSQTPSHSSRSSNWDTQSQTTSDSAQADEWDLPVADKATTASKPKTQEVDVWGLPVTPIEEKPEMSWDTTPKAEKSNPFDSMPAPAPVSQPLPASNNDGKAVKQVPKDSQSRFEASLKARQNAGWSSSDQQVNDTWDAPAPAQSHQHSESSWNSVPPKPPSESHKPSRPNSRASGEWNSRSSSRAESHGITRQPRNPGPEERWSKPEEKETGWGDQDDMEKQKVEMAKAMLEDDGWGFTTPATVKKVEATAEHIDDGWGVSAASKDDGWGNSSSSQPQDDGWGGSSAKKDNSWSNSNESFKRPSSNRNGFTQRSNRSMWSDHSKSRSQEDDRKPLERSQPTKGQDNGWGDASQPAQDAQDDGWGVSAIQSQVYTNQTIPPSANSQDEGWGVVEPSKKGDAIDDDWGTSKEPPKETVETGWGDEQTTSAENQAIGSTVSKGLQLGFTPSYPPLKSEQPVKSKFDKFKPRPDAPKSKAALNDWRTRDTDHESSSTFFQKYDIVVANGGIPPTGYTPATRPIPAWVSPSIKQKAALSLSAPEFKPATSPTTPIIVTTQQSSPPSPSTEEISAKARIESQPLAMSNDKQASPSLVEASLSPSKLTAALSAQAPVFTPSTPSLSAASLSRQPSTFETLPQTPAIFNSDSQYLAPTHSAPLTAENIEVVQAHGSPLSYDAPVYLPSEALQSPEPPVLVTLPTSFFSSDPNSYYPESYKPKPPPNPYGQDRFSVAQLTQSVVEDEEEEDLESRMDAIHHFKLECKDGLEGKTKAVIELIEHFLSQPDQAEPLRTIIFASAQHEALFLARKLRQAFKGRLSTTCLATADLSFFVKDKELKSYESGKTNILICGHVLHRPLKDPDAELMIHLEPPLRKGKEEDIDIDVYAGRLLSAFGKAGVSILVQDEVDVVYDGLETALSTVVETIEDNRENLMKVLKSVQATNSIQTI